MKTKQGISLPTSGMVQVIESGNTSIAKLRQLLEDTLREFSSSDSAKLPATITRGDNWVCVASAIGDICLSINLTEIGRAN